MKVELLILLTIIPANRFIKGENNNAFAGKTIGITIVKTLMQRLG